MSTPRTQRLWFPAVVAAFLIAGCGEESSDAPAGPDEGVGGETGEGGEAGADGEGGSAGQSASGGAAGSAGASSGGNGGAAGQGGGSGAGGASGKGGSAGTAGSGGKGGAAGSGGKGGAAGSGGQCTPGTNAVQGTFDNDASPVVFDQAQVSLAHKQDVDPVEGGCITRVQIDLQAGAGCTLTLRASTPYAWQGGLTIDSISFTADSFCPGFSDAEEGVYAGAGELTMAQVVPQAQAVDDTDASSTVLDSSMTVKLEGVLRRKSDNVPLAVAPTQLTVKGCFPSAGDTSAKCPCKPSCPLGCSASGESCNYCKSTDQKCEGGKLYACNSTGTDFEPTTTCQYGCEAGGLTCSPPPHDAAIGVFAPVIRMTYHEGLKYYTSWYDVEFTIVNAGTQQLKECIDYKIYTNSATLPSTPPDPYKDFEGQTCVDLAPGGSKTVKMASTYANPSSPSATGTAWAVLSIADDDLTNNTKSATWHVIVDSIW